jgi:hypothetical protein
MGALLTTDRWLDGAMPVTGARRRPRLRSALWLPLFDDLAATIAGLRAHPPAPYDIAVGLPPGTDPAPYAEAGATWWLPEFDPATVSLDQVRGVLRDGPAKP